MYYEQKGKYLVAIDSTGLLHLRDSSPEKREITWNKKTGHWKRGSQKGRTYSYEEIQRIYDSPLPPEQPRVERTPWRKAVKRQWGAPLSQRFTWKDSAGYLKYLQSPWWKQRRQSRLRQAGWRCQECGVGGLLQVHHLAYDRVWEERDSDLQVLCRPCHEKKHPDKVNPSI